MIEELRRLEAEAPIVNEAAMRAYYEEHLAYFTDPELLTYEAILLHREADALDVAEKVSQGADMWTLAQAYPRFHDAWFHYNIYHIHREEDAQHAHSPHTMSEVLAAVRKTPVGKVGGPFLVHFQPREKSGRDTSCFAHWSNAPPAGDLSPILRFSRSLQRWYDRQMASVLRSVLKLF